MIRKKRIEVNLSASEAAKKLNMSVGKYLKLERKMVNATLKDNYLLSMGLHANYSQEK